MPGKKLCHLKRTHMKSGIKMPRVRDVEPYNKYRLARLIGVLLLKLPRLPAQVFLLHP